MKLEIIKEERYGESAWYFLKADEVTVKCSKSLEEIQDSYNEIISDPDLLTLKKTILKSAEIIVNL